MIPRNGNVNRVFQRGSSHCRRVKAAVDVVARRVHEMFLSSKAPDLMRTASVTVHFTASVLPSQIVIEFFMSATNEGLVPEHDDLPQTTSA